MIIVKICAALNTDIMFKQLKEMKFLKRFFLCVKTIY